MSNYELVLQCVALESGDSEQERYMWLGAWWNLYREALLP